MQHLLYRIQELEELLNVSERKADILTNLLKEASAEFEQAFKKVTESESNFKAIFENAPEAIYIFCTDTRMLLDCNSFTVEWLGYSRSELLSMRVDDILAPGTTGISNNISTLVDKGAVRISERRFRKKNGALVDAEVTGALVVYAGRRAMVALVRDITERKTLDELARYKALFDNVSDPVFISDARGRFLEVNDVACGLFEYPRQQLLQKAVKHLLAPDQQPVLANMWARLQREGALTFQMDMLTRMGSRLPVECHSRPIVFLGQPAILSVARDVRARKKMEEMLIRNERLSALGSMATGVAHNYNNLLQMIIALSEAAASKLAAGRIRETHEAIRHILEAGRRGADTVRRIRDFVDVRSGTVADSAPFDMATLLQEVLALMQTLWQSPEQHGKYTLKLEPLPECMVDANASEIYEVLINLIKNAIEAMPAGGALHISHQITATQIHLTIADTGCGILPQNLERIFEPFFTTKGTRSSGLGLPSSFGIIKRNQGEMTATSCPGQGASFCITLPRASALPSPAEPEIIPNSPKKVRLLLIDDEINILKAMEMFFEDTDIELAVVSKASEGIRMLEDAPPDVILCDLSMDDINGWEVAKIVKDICIKKEIPHIHFVLYTGLDKPLDPQKLLASGIDRVVTKPVSCLEIERIVQEVMHKKPL